MKKLNLCILALFLIPAFLFAVESEPSEVVGYVAYECVLGTTGNLNFIALPMDTGYEMASDLGNDYPGIIVEISYWDAAGQLWQSSPKVGDIWVDNFPVYPANAYMIDIESAFTFYSVGSLVPPVQYDLLVDLNFIMVPLHSPYSGYTMAGQLGDDIGPLAAELSTWEAALQLWQSSPKVGDIWVDNFPIQIAMPLMVDMSGPLSWPDLGTRLQTRN